jgi:hypothetical protein
MHNDNVLSLIKYSALAWSILLGPALLLALLAG